MKKGALPLKIYAPQLAGGSSPTHSSNQKCIHEPSETERVITSSADKCIYLKLIEFHLGSQEPRDLNNFVK